MNIFHCDAAEALLSICSDVVASFEQFICLSVPSSCEEMLLWFISVPLNMCTLVSLTIIVHKLQQIGRNGKRSSLSALRKLFKQKAEQRH